MSRSYQTINHLDLQKLLLLAYNDMDSFFDKNRKYTELYKEKEVLVALGQEAVLSYIDRKNDIKDFNVWFFYPRKRLGLPYVRRGVANFGESRLINGLSDKRFKGRRVDVLMRSDSCFNDGKPEECLRQYFSKTKTAKLLSEKAMIALCPQSLFGQILRPRISEDV